MARTRLSARRMTSPFSFSALGLKMRPASERLDVSTEELKAPLVRARQEPLEPDGYEKLKAAIRTLKQEDQ
jgi:hypothetical protein